jgi:hypothetical protein
MGAASRGSGNLELEGGTFEKFINYIMYFRV